MKNNNRWILVALGIGLLLVFGIIAFLLLSPKSDGENALPTLIVLNTDSPTENPSDTATEASIATSESSPTIEASSTEAEAADTATTAPSATHTTAPQPSMTNTVAPQASATTSSVLPEASATSGGLIVISTQAPVETLAPTISPQASLTPAPASTLDTTGLIIFNEAVNVGAGDLRVLSMTAPADEVILSLGGNLPSIQPNQQWVLVELFMVCSGAGNCAPATSSFRLQSNQNRYEITPINIESVFGSLLLDNQVLGHLAFVIPRNESPFALELNHNGQVYRFALQ